MTKRIASIDVLRGLAIFLMVLSSTIWHSGLPAWMYHAQVPPPDFVFNPGIKGISWVDLVFPFFLFSMGASLPFSLRSRLEKSKSGLSVILGIFKRWILLAAFGVVLGNAYTISGQGSEVYKLAIWLGMFLTLWRVPSGSKIKPWVINSLGVAVVALLFVGAHFIFDLKFSPNTNNIIIMVLSSMALVCGLVWFVTRNRPGLRWILILVFAVLKEVNWHTHCFESWEAPSWLYWLINWRYLQYVVVTLIGSEIGDLLLAASKSGKPLCGVKSEGQSFCGMTIAAFIAFAMTPAMLWGFYSRHIKAAFIIVCAAYIAYLLLTRKDNSVSSIIGRLGFALLLCGVALDPLDGGITKDHCNLCYMVSTSALASLMTSFFLWWESVGKLPRALGMTGQNPMIAYTITGFVTSPVLYLVGFSAIDALCDGSPVIGILRGFIVTGVMVLCTCVFTRFKIFWRT